MEKGVEVFPMPKNWSKGLTKETDDRIRKCSENSERRKVYGGKFDVTDSRFFSRFFCWL
jgi:hypothetical protein